MEMLPAVAAAGARNVVSVRARMEDLELLRGAILVPEQLRYLRIHNRYDDRVLLLERAHARREAGASTPFQARRHGDTRGSFVHDPILVDEHHPSTYAAAGHFRNRASGALLEMT